MLPTTWYAFLAAVTCIATYRQCARDPSVRVGATFGGVGFVCLGLLARSVGPWPETPLAHFVLLQTSALYYPLFAYAVGLGLGGGAVAQALSHALRERK
jgi:hypothetical protein